MRQACRPKHQVLILKCYPKFQKNAVDVKPNSSELSYLLYYASTRRSKVQKVGEFLEKRTASDVWRGKTGKLQVTLQILKALMDKSPRDLPLYAPSVLRILGTVLRSKDIDMVESSIPTFEAFCTHYDVATLAASQQHIQQYDEIVKLYAGFAADSPPVQIKGAISKPIAIRWRSVGLQAIKCVASSEALGSDGGRQLGIVLPVILQNLYSEDEDHLLLLQQREQSKEAIEKDQGNRRRMSTATARTNETLDASPIAASGTAADVDRLAEEEVGLLALHSLKQIFSIDNKGQIRMATAATLRFITNKAPPKSTAVRRVANSGGSGGWATTLIDILARWTPVQDRYLILVTVMDTLVRSPVMEENLEQQLILVNLSAWLLGSSINLIGLSIMDVLLGLIQHVLLLLQLGGKGSNVQPHLQQTDAIGNETVSKEAAGSRLSSETLPKAATTEIVRSPSPPRIELLLRLQNCIGDLATHIYYSEQIPDMISAILLRLKPSPMSAISNPAVAIENPTAAAQAISISANLHEKPNTDDFFSFDTARVTALQAIKEILVVANMRASVTGAAATGRNSVGAQVWDGTQWLLRDSDGRVRKAYVDALLTWLRLEMSKSDLLVVEDYPKPTKMISRVENEEMSGSSLARRAVSNASQREKALRPAKSTFLQLLHLAIYENAIHHAESESDILLLHLLATNLIEKLGVNAVKNGLPMMFRLQEDIQVVENPSAKIRLGSLVHAYFLAIIQVFDFGVTPVGREIQSEVERRRRRGLWVEKIRLPPLPLERIDLPENSPIQEKTRLPMQIVESESLKPFDGRAAMVERITMAYVKSLESPPTSPPASPHRKSSIAAVDFSKASSTTPVPEQQLPVKAKEQLLSDWTKETIIASIEKESNKTASVNGSRTGTRTSGGRNFLAVNGLNGDNSGTQSPHAQHHHHHHHHQHQHQSRPPSAAYGLVGGTGLGALQKIRTGSVQDGSPTPISSSSRDSTVRVDDLKRILSGNVGPVGTLPRRYEPAGEDDSSDSMVSGDYSGSDSSFAGANVDSRIGKEQYSGADEPATSTAGNQDTQRQVTFRRGSSPVPKAFDVSESAPKTAIKGDVYDNEASNSVPPVPPFPRSLSMQVPAATGRTSSPTTLSPTDLRSTSRSLKRQKSRGGMSDASGGEKDPWGIRPGGKVDLGGLLRGIEVGGGDVGKKSVVKPPY
ncbi:MAG: plasma membrane localization protein [Pycnora praestabilis]|nr:MAG: plasma membrane localization protein [Pycnora praestabilis]